MYYLYAYLLHTFLRKVENVLRKIFDMSEQTSTVVLLVLASNFARVIFVNCRRQLPEGFATGAGSFRRIRD